MSLESWDSRWVREQYLYFLFELINLLLELFELTDAGGAGVGSLTLEGGEFDEVAFE